MQHHSQSRQDQLLDVHLFRGLRNGVFLDIGAYDGVALSNSLFFEEERGWTGICIEADPESFAALVKRRPAAINLNVAAGGTAGRALFTQANMLGGLASSVDMGRIALEQIEHRAIEVSVRPIADILSEYGVKEVHYVSLDVEGAEPEVLAGFDLERVLVHAMTVECNTLESERPVRGALERAGFACCGRVEADLFFVNHRSRFFRTHRRLQKAISGPDRPTLGLRRAVGSIARKLGLRPPLSGA